MTEREPDPDLVAEAADERRQRALERQRAAAWDDPPDYDAE